MGLLSIEGLSVSLPSPGGRAIVVDDIDLEIAAGEMLGLVGESGCGKSVTALSIMRLIPEDIGQVEGGSIRLDETDILALSRSELRAVRGNRIGMIFQEPMTSLNPVLTVGDQVAEALRIHRGLGRRAALAKAVRLMDRVGIPNAAGRAGRYPHELSGGQRQRIMIAAALACEPKLLIADEPTTALDVTIQAQILDLLDGLRRETGMAVLLITHDLGVVAEYCDRVAVMYAGRIVELAGVEALFAHPRHPYTAGLLRSMPASHGTRLDRLPAIAGAVPPPGARGTGCHFAPRCDRRLERCTIERPPLEGGAACWNPL